MTKGFEEAKKSSENPEPELKPLIGYFMAVQLVKHTTDGVMAARLIEQHSLKMEHIPSTLLNSKEVKTVLHKNIKHCRCIYICYRTNKVQN